jgi:hypothetical protein
MVEAMLSDEILLTITGNPIWADRCEDITFNSLPAAFTADMKALHYLTAPNMILCDRHNKSPGLQNGGPMLHFNPHIHRCCQHNTGHGWPYYAQHLWLATPGNGLAAVLCAPSKVTAKVADGTEVTILEDTKYPFDETIDFEIKTSQKVTFPLYLRIPKWCENPVLEVNSEPIPIKSRPLSYIRLERKWSNNDKVRLVLPMRITLHKWAENKNSVSVDRGPLTYSLKIEEEYIREGGTDEWPAWEIHPASPWNYGLVLYEDYPEDELEFVPASWPGDDQPFRFDTAPVTIRANAKKIPQWQKDKLGLVGSLQQSPAKSDQPTEKVTLIPMGCARLRISAFPTIGSGRDAHQWIEPPKPAKPIPTRASHCWGGDTTDACSDKLLPRNSNDHGIPRLTWWDHKGTTEWVQYDFPKPTKVAGVDVYWFDDTGRGFCRIPASWRLLYKEANQFKPVTNPTTFGVEKNKFNKVTFDEIETDSIKIEVQLKPDFSAGILEWRVNPK